MTEGKGSLDAAVRRLTETATHGVVGGVKHPQLANDLREVLTALSIARDALNEISAGEGYYGAQAREYKHVARAALSRTQP